MLYCTIVYTAVCEQRKNEMNGALSDVCSDCVKGSVFCVVHVSDFSINKMPRTAKFNNRK
jgi:hypothetical protein